MHIFHSYLIPSNFLKLRFVIKLQKIELVFGHTDEWTDGRTNGWTDKRGSRNSYLDYCIMRLLSHTTFTIHDASARNFVRFDTQYDTVFQQYMMSLKIII